MVMGFKTKIGDYATNFPAKILDGSKIHSIREGHRWKPGMLIHPATGVRTKDYKQITAGPLTCISTQDIEIYIKQTIPGYFITSIRIDGVTINFRKTKLLSKNDGFEHHRLFASAFFHLHPSGLKGQIVHWTDYRY